jgi:hypothetical protein
MKEYIGSQEHFEDEVNAYYEQKEQFEWEQQKQYENEIMKEIEREYYNSQRHEGEAPETCA